MSTVKQGSWFQKEEDLYSSLLYFNINLNKGFFNPLSHYGA
jgi:hypothetical protein